MDKRQEFLRRADEIIRKIEAVLSEDYDNRTEKISDSDLRDMLNLVKERKIIVETNQIPPKKMRYRSLSRIVIDQWPLGTSLGNEISQLESIYINL